MKTEYTYIDFVQLPTKDGLKTSIWACRNKNDARLGTIKWFSHWRRYVFFPDDGVLFDAACLKDIVAFIEQLMDARKKDAGLERKP